MWPRSPRRSSRAGAGFTLVELLVVMASVVVILVLAGQVLFASRQLSDRQRLQVESRQLARGAVDYVTFLMRGASDFNVAGGNRGAIVTWLEFGSTAATAGCPGSANCVPTAWNNVPDMVVGGSRLADPGTDIITFSRPNAPFTAEAAFWPGFQHGANVRWEFGLGCPSDAENMRLFQEMTGAIGSGNQATSGELMVVDDNGNWVMYMITSYQNSFCGRTPPQVHVVSNPGGSGMLNPPGGQPTLNNPKLVLGVEFTALRVCNGWLEQKQGLFRGGTPTAPGADYNCPVVNDGTYVPKPGWRPLLPNVADFQIGYIYRDGQLRNNRIGNSLTTALPNGTLVGAPPQGSALATDISRVIGFRIQVTTRTSGPVFAEFQNRHLRPGALDRPAAPASERTRLAHYQLSGDALIRNRTPRM